MSETEFERKMSKLMSGLQVRDSTRTMTIMTGMEGAKMLDKAVKFDVYKAQIKGWEDEDSLKEMLLSEDVESNELAVAIIEQRLSEKKKKKKEDGFNI